MMIPGDRAIEGRQINSSFLTIDDRVIAIERESALQTHLRLGKVGGINKDGLCGSDFRLASPLHDGCFTVGTMSRCDFFRRGWSKEIKADTVPSYARQQGAFRQRAINPAVFTRVVFERIYRFPSWVPQRIHRTGRVQGQFTNVPSTFKD